MLNWRNIVLSSILAGTLIAPTAVYGRANLNNNLVESCKIYSEPENEEKKCPDCKDEHEIFQKRMEKRMEDRNKLIDKADKIVPGTKSQWEKVSNERKELLTKLRESKPEKEDNQGENLKEKFKNRQNMKETNKKKWEDLNEAVKDKDAQKVKSSFHSILQTMKEKNEKLSEKINNAKK